VAKPIASTQADQRSLEIDQAATRAAAAHPN
jgi:hypothetical protein